MSAIPGFPTAPVGAPVAAPTPVSPVAQALGVPSPVGAPVAAPVLPPAGVPGDVTGPTGSPANATVAPPIVGSDAPVAATGAEAPKKRNRKPRLVYRADGAPKLEAVPTDFNAKTHLPMAKDDFANEALYWDWKAAELEKSVAVARKNAQDCREGRGGEQKKALDKAAKAVKLLQEMEPVLRAAMGDAAYEQWKAAQAALPAANAAAVAAGV